MLIVVFHSNLLEGVNPDDPRRAKVMLGSDRAGDEGLARRMLKATERCLHLTEVTRDIEVSRLYLRRSSRSSYVTTASSLEIHAGDAMGCLDQNVLATGY